MRRPFVAGNWKMNLHLGDARELVRQIRTQFSPDMSEKVDVAVCPPFIYLIPLSEVTQDCPVELGAQNMYFEKDGAFTGEISPSMVVETQCRYVILGHSERRHSIGKGESDRMLNRKVRAARAVELTPILCVGETLAERDRGDTLEVLTYQLTAGLVGVEVARATDLVIAYEPVWAIGTGRNATPDQAQEAHAHLRGELRRLIGDVADEIRIQYGGSVKPDNAREIFSQPDVDGGLIGGASLKAESFLAIVQAAVDARS